MVQRSILAALIAAALAAGCAPRHGASAAQEKSEVDDVEAWRAKRYDNLKKPGGWLSLAGLAWLHEGDNAAGAAPSSDVPFPATAPAQIGTFTVHGKSFHFRPAPGVAVTSGGKPVEGDLAVTSDGDGASDPTELVLGSITFYVIERGGKSAVRITDLDAPARKSFTAIDHWPVDPKWRVEARWQAFDPPHHLEVSTVVPGLTQDYPVPGVATFEIDGKTYRLEPVLETGETDLFFIFADATTGKETYGAGRFLYAKPPVDGKVVIDFNRAYNPPCAFTAFATCPLAPQENHLPIRVEAGEKKYESR